jgi:hypothetical protein
VFNQKPLNPTDLNRMIGTFGAVFGFEYRAALFLAQSVGRTQDTASAAQDVILFNCADGTGNVFKSKFSNKFSWLGISRAPLGAGGVMAKQAAIGFGNGLGQTEPFVHFLKFIGTTHYFSSL